MRVGEADEVVVAERETHVDGTTGEREVEIVVGEVEPLDPLEAPAADVASDDGAHVEADDTIVVGYEDPLDALPELARLAAVAWVRTAAWSLRTSARLARSTLDPQTAGDLVQGVGAGMRSYAREFLGITDLEEHVRLLTPPGDRFAGNGTGALGRGEVGSAASPELALRTQGAELLRQSADVTSDDRLHPAFGRILAELAPDEGRILRLLSVEGPQPVVDVRAANLIGVGSQLVTQNLNMVGMPAGVRHADRVDAYLGNLQRLGLVAFAEEPLEDPITYQVLEAQPHVLDAIKATARAKTVHRSLRLTPFGAEFCAVCFPAELDEVKALLDEQPPLAAGEPDLS
jgi:hypothetical protein